MRVVVHRVRSAVAEVDSGDQRGIAEGLVLLVGLDRSDDESTVERLAAKAARLRVFPTTRGMFEDSAASLGMEAMTVAQVPLVADTTRGTRPNLSRAADPASADTLYSRFGERLLSEGLPRVVAIPFGASVTLTVRHWGPCSFVLG